METKKYLIIGTEGQCGTDIIFQGHTTDWKAKVQTVDDGMLEDFDNINWAIGEVDGVTSYACDEFFIFVGEDKSTVLNQCYDDRM